MAILINGDGHTPVTAQQDADLFAAIFGGESNVVLPIGNRMAASIQTANSVRISDGELITMEGRRIHLNSGAYDDFDIPNGEQSVTNYYIIGYHLYADASSNQLCETFVQKMSSATATVEQKNLRDGNSECYVSMYRITQTGLTIEAVEALYSAYNGASGVKLVSGNDTDDSIRFGRDANGNYGYFKTGSDELVNFRKPVGTAKQAQVLAGFTFANSDSDSITGTMPNRGSVTLTPIDGGTVSAPAGYYSEIKADGSKAYAAARAVKVGSVTGSGTLNCTGIAGWQNLTVNNFLCVPNANASASSTANSNHTDQWTAGTASSNSNFYRPYASSYSNGIVTISGGSFEGHTYLSNLGQTFGSGTKITCDVWIIH